MTLTLIYQIFVNSVDFIAHTCNKNKSLFTDERNINYIKKVASVITPFKVNLEVCLEISRHDGLQIFYNINFR